MGINDVQHSEDHGVHIHGISPGYLVGEIIIFLFSISGLLLNLLVFYILVIRIRILKIDAVLSILTTIFDVTGILALLIRIVYKWSTAGHNLPSKDFMFCKATGTIIFGSTISSIDIVSILGLIRCFIIVFKKNMKAVFWAVILVILIAYNWIGGGIFVWYFDEISWGDFCNRNDYLLREAGFNESPAFQYITAIKSLIMLLIVCISYSIIFNFYQRYFDSIKSRSLSDQSLVTEYNIQRSTTSIKLISLITAYIITYGPKVYLFIAYAFKFHQKSPSFELVTSILFSIVALINASVILFIQEETKQEWQILTTLFTQKIKYNLKR
jgi:hypothetical protein